MAHDTCAYSWCIPKQILGISQELVVATQREDSNTSGESLSDVDLQGAGLGRGVLQVLHGSTLRCIVPQKDCPQFQN